MPATWSSESARRISSVNAVPTTVRPSEMTMPRPRPASTNRFMTFAMTKLRLAGLRPATASMAARRLPIQPSPVSRTPTRPTIPTPVRALMAVLIDSLSVLPKDPGTFRVMLSNRLCCAAGCACRTKPVIATAYWLPLFSCIRFHASAVCRTDGRRARRPRQRIVTAAFTRANTSAPSWSAAERELGAPVPSPVVIAREQDEVVDGEPGDVAGQPVVGGVQRVVADVLRDRDVGVVRELQLAVQRPAADRPFEQLALGQPARDLDEHHRRS